GKNAIRLRNLETKADTELVAAPTVGHWGCLTFSPKSDQVLFVHQLPGPWRLMRVPVTGGTPIKLVDDPDGGGSLSPDGRMLAFDRDRDEKGMDLLLADPDGTNEKVLVHTPGENEWINCGDVTTWAPDGKSLACWIDTK